MQKKRMIMACGLLVFTAIIAGGVLLYRARSSSSDGGARQPVAGSSVDAAQGIPFSQSSGFRLADAPDGIAGDWLASLISVDRLDMPKPQADQLRSDASAWIRASTMQSHEALAGVFAEHGVTPIRSWGTDEMLAKESWANSLGNLGAVVFDASDAGVASIRPLAPEPFARKNKRCSRRDDARPFLAQRGTNHPDDVQIVFAGKIPEPADHTPVAITVAYRFAWNQEKKRWTLVQICLYDYPNAYPVYSMIL